MKPADLSANLVARMTERRRHLHSIPELQFDLPKTVEYITACLSEIGCDEIVSGVGGCGIVAWIDGHGGARRRTIGLRADMDALPIAESSNLPWRSTHQGRMHACGHDGHTAMLLGAADHLAQHRDFAGRVVFIFQPAEEEGAGGLAMVNDGMMDRFGIEEVYGIHNAPGLPIGAFATRPGALLAACDEFEVHLTGPGGHAAQPHKTVDPIVASAAIINSVQTITTRDTDPMQNLVISITQIHAGASNNVIPELAVMTGTIRTLDAALREATLARFEPLCAQVAQVHGVDCSVQIDRGYPVVVNDAACTAHAVRAARNVAAPEAIEPDMSPLMGAEDFAYMLEVRPGAFMIIGNGDTAELHQPDYDFNDGALAVGAAYWVALVHARLAAKGSDT